MLKLITIIADFICNPFKNVLLYHDVSFCIQPPRLSDNDIDLLLSRVSAKPIVEASMLSIAKLYLSDKGIKG